MQHIQGSFFTGYVTVEIEGQRPELFFQICIKQGITVWNVKKISDDVCKGNIRLKDIAKTKEIIEETPFIMSIKQKKGYPIILQQLLKTKELLLAISLCILLVIFLSNIIWNVSVTGVSKEVEEKISDELEKHGVYRGNWFFAIDSPSSLQQNLVNDIPELLWIGVQKKGTTFVLEGVEKTIVKKEESYDPRHLVATKKGIISKVYISKGIAKVHVNDYVEAEDILVSGIMNEDDDSKELEEDKEDASDLELVAAEGEVTANTWYEIAVTVPLEINNERLTGDYKNKYYLQIGKVQLPIWGFRNPNFKEIHREFDHKSLYFWKWKLPLNIIKTKLSEKVYNKEKRTKEEAIEVGRTQAKNELQLQLGPKAIILSEKVLHETTENGKVKLIMYVSVEEDITKAEPITQGD